jgi:hypothetical protein
VDQRGFSDGTGEVRDHPDIVRLGESDDLQELRGAADVGERDAGVVAQLLFDQHADAPLATKQFADRDRDLRALPDGFVRLHVFAANEILTEIGVERFKEGGEIDGVREIQFVWKSIAQPPSPVPLWRRMQSSCILRTSLNRSTTLAGRLTGG